MATAKYSTNGTSWSTATFTTAVSGNFLGFENNNYQWVALTTNGELWENNQVSDNLGEFSLVSSYPTGLKQISSFNNNFFAINNENSYNGITTQLQQTNISWKKQEPNFADSFINSIAYGNDLWVAVGSYGKIRTSTDGSTWTTVTSNFGATNSFSRITSISYGNSLWVAGGTYGQMRTSTNGSTWTTVTSNFNTTQSSNIVGISYGNNIWVAIARRDPFPANQSEEFRTSTDGSTWTTVTSNWPSGRSLWPYALAYGNGLWIVGGDSGTMRTSTNGSTWTTVTSNFGATITSISYGNSLWVAGGAVGQLRTSTNGSTWTTVTSNFGSTIINSIGYGNGTWVAGTYSGEVQVSTNGSTWTTVNSEFGTTRINSIAYGNSLWIAGGGNGKIITSTNPSNMYQFNKLIKSSDEERAAFVNNSGQILNWNNTSWDEINTGINDNFVSGAIRNNNGTYEYIIQGNNALYRSTNLTEWATISRPSASNVNDIIGK